MIERFDLPIVAGAPGSALPVAGDTVMLLSVEEAWIIRIRHVRGVTWPGNGIAILDVYAEREAYQGHHSAKHR